MCKLFIIIAFTIIAYAAAATSTTTRPTRCASVCPPRPQGNSLCVRERRGRVCRKLRMCQIDEENCRRIEQGLSGLLITDNSSCRDTGAIGAAGPCQPFNCRTIICEQANAQARCYASRNRCKLATECTVLRENCSLTARNQLRRTTNSRCRGMVAGQALRRCA